MQRLNEILAEYFRWTNNREPEGFLSWQHLTYVTVMVFTAIALGILVGRRCSGKEKTEKRKVLRISSAVILGLELFKIVLICIRNKDIASVRSMLPLFLCSIMLFSLPLAAFSKGRLQEAALDFSLCFGIVMCIAGTYLAGNYFSGSPVLSFDPMVSVTSHCVSGFASIYIGVSGMASMKKRNLWISAVILLLFEGLALTVDLLQRNTDYESNYMFFMNSAGTPFSILETLAGGNQVLYTCFVAALYFVYWGLAVGVFHMVRRLSEHRRKCMLEKQNLPV